MTRATLIKTIWVLFMSLFLSVQGLSQAHAAANGGTEHKHEGVICAVALVAAEQTALTPPLPFASPPEIAQTPLWQPLVERNLPRTFDGRAPPPRAPPTL
ncbi:hypothetical protein GCM10011309_01640 [Litorimonas cladophorae]|uniref:Uncharacterized protein n=1 Tax=Litorimonas cladophorae TaxID=1220491 RepID=A0A918KB02_9PROT|nr:hypothetical protein [Litorimonas cladophorae]GGX56517.1 hypothetical protein GCM10011309_01640 [Litorimonas cladophorae]